MLKLYVKIIAKKPCFSFRNHKPSIAINFVAYKYWQKI
jgi:hypothetical protein